MGVLFARAFAQQALLDAWHEVRDAALADGKPDQQVDAFEVDAARKISALADELAEGAWQPDPVYRVEIPKSRGGFRVLGVPSLADRIVERALLRVIDPVIDPLLLPWSFAYRRGLGVKDALAALAEARDEGLPWVARADIDDCFPSIPRWEVMRRVRETIGDERIVHLVGLLLDRPVAGTRQARADRGLGLHQGSPVSPVLSNLYLDAFDRGMLQAGWRVIRYGDDFAIPTASRADAERALVSASTELEALRLELNVGKSHVASFDEGERFLGEVTTASTINRGETLSHPLETVVYVDRQGALVRSKGDRLVVTDGDESLLRLGLRRVRQVVCYGRVGLTTAFLHRAVDRGIEVVLLTEQGSLGGRLTTPMTSDPQVRRAQYRAADDDGECRRLATALVDGKVGNLRVALLRAARREDNEQAAFAADLLAEMATDLGSRPSLDALRGVEGTASREYFQALRRMLDPEWGFGGRQRRPPPDPSTPCCPTATPCSPTRRSPRPSRPGWTQWSGSCTSTAGDGPRSPSTSWRSSARSPSTSPSGAASAPSRVRPEQFEHDPALGCRMGADARHAFLAAYERRMLTLTTHQPSGRRVSYRVAMGLQAKLLARTLLDPDEPYQPLRWK